MAGWREPWGKLELKGDAVYWEGEGELLKLEPWGENALRFRASKRLEIPDEDWTLLPPGKHRALVEREDERIVIRNGKIGAEVLINGTVNYFDAKGEYILEEYWIDKREERVPHRRAREYRHHSSDSFRTSLYFKANPQERFYGMGQVPNGCFDLKGTVIELQQKNGHCVIPFLLSSENYGFLWNNPAVGQAELVHNHTRWYAEATRGIDYVVTAGDSPDELLQNYTGLTGRPPMLPDFASGFWQCKLRYRSQEELLEVAREYRRRGLPLSVIVIDYFQWTEQGAWRFAGEVVECLIAERFSQLFEAFKPIGQRIDAVHIQGDEVVAVFVEKLAHDARGVGPLGAGVRQAIALQHHALVV